MKKVGVLILLAAGIYLSFRFLLPLVLPFVIAGIVSVIYYPFLRKLYRNSDVWSGKKKKWILVISVVLLYMVLLLLIGWVCGYLFDQGHSILLNYPFYQAKLMCLLKHCCCRVDTLFHMEDGVCFAYISDMADNIWGNSMSAVIPKVTTYSVQAAGRLFGIVFEIVITVIATFFLIQDYEWIRGKMLQSEIGKSICQVIVKCKETLKTYLKAQGCIMLMDGALCTLAFFVIDQPYFLILGPLVAIVDSLPVLGAGMILIPYMLILLLMKRVGKAAVLLTAYLGCLLIRQITEPKMIGNKVGMRPLYTIMSMYVGFRLFGVFGFLLGPLGVLIGRELYVKMIADVERDT